jgi:hypothetical protein
MASIEALLLHSHSCFAHSPKKVTEFHTLAEQMETKRLKLLKNVKTRWINCHLPLRRMLSRWISVMAKMWVEKIDKTSGKKNKISIFLYA